MGNIMLSGQPELVESLNIDVSTMPPWVCLWVAVWMDRICRPLYCREHWRDSLVPFWSQEGQCLAEEFNADKYFDSWTPYQTFSEFLAQQPDGPTAGLATLLYRYAFETPSTSLASLTTPTALGTLVALVLVIRAFKAIFLPRFQNVGRTWALKAHGPQWVAAHEERMIKFGEYVYRLVYHSSISGFGIWLFWNAPWWNDDQGGTYNLWVRKDSPISPGLCWYYLLQAAYNVDAFVSLLEVSFKLHFFPPNSLLPVTIGWSETVRGDFNEMAIHHIVTNALIFLSGGMREMRIGSMVFWMHDLSDVPVDLSKLANFVKWKKSTVAAFLLMCFMWFYTRLYILPFKILRSMLKESLHYLVVDETIPFKLYYTFLPMFTFLLGVLVVLHAFWFTMFINMLIVLASKGEAHDLTDYKQGEAAEEQVSNKNESTTTAKTENGGKKTN